MEPQSVSTAIFLIALGSAALYLGAESLVKGSVGLALRIGITPLIIGLTVVAFGTSSPELIVSFTAGFEGKSEIALGNVIGSNICNVALILGVASLLRPIKVDMKLFRRDIPIMIAVSFLMIIFILDGEISRIEGAVLALGIIAYTVFTIIKSRNDKRLQELMEQEVVHLDKTRVQKRRSSSLYILMVLVGLGILAIGANMFLEGAIYVAQSLGASEAIIGLSLVALGTSLPELATSVVASVKDEGDISMGNVIGSNIFNILMILGFTGLAFTISAEGFTVIDVSVMMGLSIVLIPLALHKRTLTRGNGAILLTMYFGYMYYLYTTLPTT